MKKKKQLIAILSILLVIAIGILFFMMGQNPNDSDVVDPKPQDPNGEVVKPNSNTEEEGFTQQDWNDNHAINSDYIGQLYFESGLFEFPVVQGASNDTYISTDWQTMQYFIEGSIFMDYRNYYEGEFEDQNLIIYGHYVYADETHMFGPLHYLKEEKKYEENKYINLHLKDELRRYEIAHVYYCELVDDGEGNFLYTRDDMRYYLTDFKEDPAYFETYLKAIKDAEFYETGNDIEIDDRLLTLQTCVRDHDELRLIVVAKEIERIPQ